MFFLCIFLAFFEPTDMRIAGKPFQLPIDLVRQIKFVSPNIYELNEIAKTLNFTNDIPTGIPLDTLLRSHVTELKALAAHVNEYVDNILVTLGSNGLLIVRKCDANVPFYREGHGFAVAQNECKSTFRLYPAHSIDDVVNVSGAGDSFNSGFITAAIRYRSEATCVAVGFQGAITALRSNAAVPQEYFGLEHKCWHQEASYQQF